ncbi:hypothetical protein ABDF71_22625 [Ochrobactrum sp. WV_118_8]
MKAAATALANYIGHGMTEKCVDKATVALTAALPHLPQGVGVKELEWRQEENGDFIAESIVGWYHIGLPHRMWNLTKPIGEVFSFWTLDEARASAQADYDARILSALEPSAARELALEERLQAIEQQLVVNLGYFHDEKRILLETLQSHIISHISAIRALGTSREQLNKAVSNVPDQQKNEPGAHGEWETVLDEVIALCRDYGEDSQPDSEYRLACNDIIEAIQERRSLSSPDHADAGKVEGDGCNSRELMRQEVVLMIERFYSDYTWHHQLIANVMALPSAPSQEASE